LNKGLLESHNVIFVKRVGVGGKSCAFGKYIETGKKAKVSVPVRKSAILFGEKGGRA